MSFQGRIRTFYRHESSARKGEEWAARKVDEILERVAAGQEVLPNLGQGRSKIYRAAYRVRVIAQGKLEQNLAAHERVFWTSAADEAAAILADVMPGGSR